MRLVNRLLALGIAAGALLAAASASASAATIDVLPGDSIQAAVNKAHPGDVIVVHRGVYRESIQIKKDHLALRGAGDSRNGSVIKPEAHTNRCEGGSTGICVLAPAGGQGGAIAGTRISGFRVQG